MAELHRQSLNVSNVRFSNPDVMRNLACAIVVFHFGSSVMTALGEIIVLFFVN